MRPFIFTIGSVSISSFFFFVVVGALVATFYGVWLAKRNNLKAEAILDIGILGLVGGVLGTRIFHILVEFPGYYWEKPSRVFRFWEGGFVSWGGFIGVPLLCLLYLRLKRLPLLPYLDLVAAVSPIIKLFIRVACLLAGCCYGKPTSLPWGITFTNPSSAANYFMGAIPLHPTQVYSMIHALLLFFFIQWVYRRRRFDGETTCLLGMGWTLPRAFIEFFRGDADRGVFYGVSTGQILGLFGFFLFLYLFRRLKKKYVA